MCCVDATVRSRGNTNTNRVECRVDHVLVVPGAGDECIEDGTRIGTRADVFADLGPIAGDGAESGVVRDGVLACHLLCPALSYSGESSVDGERAESFRCAKAIDAAKKVAGRCGIRMICWGNDECGDQHAGDDGESEEVLHVTTGLLARGLLLIQVSASESMS